MLEFVTAPELADLQLAAEQMRRRRSPAQIAFWSELAGMLDGVRRDLESQGGRPHRLSLCGEPGAARTAIALASAYLLLPGTP